MMEPRAFVSCSLSEKDRPVVEYFKALIGAFRIVPDVYDVQELGRLVPAVERRIKQSDCLIAIASRKAKIADSDEYICSDWIQQEIASAHMLGKQIILFRENGVRIEGLTPSEIRSETFDRDHLCERADKHAAFLFDLREKLDSGNPRNAMKSLEYVRRSIKVEDWLAAESLTQIVEVEMESMIDSLTAVHHSNLLDHSIEHLSVKPQSFQFECVSHPPTIVVSHCKVIETDQRFVWTVSFNPPLKAGERITYRCKTQRKHDQPYTYQDVVDAIAKRHYRFQEPICKVGNWVITAPTQLLSYSIEFTKGYEIRDPRPDVTMGEALFPAEEEIRRIRENNWFHLDKRFQCWSAGFSVENPHFGYTYGLAYTPSV